LRRQSGAGRGAGPIGRGTVNVESDGEGAVGTRTAMSDAGETGEGAADGAQEQVLVETESVPRKNERAVERDIDGLGKFEGIVLRIREPDENSGRDTRFGPAGAYFRGHGARPEMDLLGVTSGRVVQRRDRSSLPVSPSMVLRQKVTGSPIQVRRRGVQTCIRLGVRLAQA